MIPFFPFGLMGSLRVANLSRAQDPVKPAVDRIVAQLDELEMKSIEPEGSTVHFTAHVFQPGSNFHTLVQFGSGTIEIDQSDGELFAKYHLSSVKMLAAIGALMGVLGAFSVATGKPLNHELLTSLAIGWVWLFSANYIWGVISFRKWLRRCLEIPSEVEPVS